MGGFLKKIVRVIRTGDGRPSHQFCHLSANSRLCLRCGGVDNGPLRNLGNRGSCSGGIGWRRTLPETDINWVAHRELRDLDVQNVQVEMTNTPSTIEAISEFILSRVPLITELDMDINTLARTFSLVENSDVTVHRIEIRNPNRDGFHPIKAAALQFTVRKLNESTVQIGIIGMLGSASISAWSFGTLIEGSTFYTITNERNGLPGVVNLPTNVSREAQGNGFRLTRGITSEDVNVAFQQMFSHLNDVLRNYEEPSLRVEELPM